MSEKVFIDGLSAKKPHPNAPDFVLSKVSINVAKLKAYLGAQTGEWVNGDLKVSQDGKHYIELDTWKPDGNRQQGQANGSPPNTDPPSDDDFEDSSIPF